MLLDPRMTYAPFEYQWAYEAFEKQQQSHWLWSEINMASDINDWKTILTESEKNVIGSTLKGFVQSELCIGEYWREKVASWFKKSEIQMMASCFANMESIHTVSYALLNQSLGLEDFDAFLMEPSAKAKIDRMMEPKSSSKEEIARSLAIFSAFNEGVSLFSSFAILMNPCRFGKLRGISQIIQFSALDENLHSEAGCKLFRTFVEEYPKIWTDDLKKDIYDAARLTIELEDNFIDKVFELGDVEGLSKKDMKNFIRERCNGRLRDLGLKSNWRNLDKESVKRMAWVENLISGVGHTDFFAQRVSSYSKGVVDFSGIWNE